MKSKVNQTLHELENAQSLKKHKIPEVVEELSIF